MKKFFSISLIFLFFFASVGQAQPLYLHWTKFIGGIMSDYAYHSISTEDSGIVFVGSTSDTLGNYDIPGSQNDSQSVIPSNLLIGKLDSNKQLAWVKVYGGSRYDDGLKVLQLANGNYAVLGNTRSYDGDVTGLKGQTDIWLLCLDGQGNLLWERTFGSTTSDEAVSFAQTSDGGFVILGSTNGSDYDVPFHYGGYFDFDWLVIKTDSSGNLQWSKNIGGTGSEDAHGSIFQADGGYFLASSTNSYDHDCDDSSWHIAPHSDYDYYLVKLDTMGNLLWSKSYGGSNNELISYAMWDDRDSTIVISGFTKSVDLMVQNNYNSFYTSIWVVKTDRNGNYIWGRRIGDSSMNNNAYNILTHMNFGYILASQCYAGFPLLPGRVGSFDTRIFLLDSTGNPFYDKIFGGTEQETYNPNIVPFKSGYAITGTTFSYDFSEGVNLYHNHSAATEVYIAALFDLPDPLSVKNKIVNQEGLKVYPNPAKDRARIELPADDVKGILTFTDSQGRTVYKESVKGERVVDVNISGWARGKYFVQWKGKNSTTPLVQKLVLAEY